MKLNPRAVLLELDRRTKAQSNGALLFFKKAGVTLVNEDEITLQDLKNLQEFQPSIFNELLDFLYPELSETANADGTGSAASNFDWQTLVGGILSGAGTGLINSSSSTVNGELAYAQYQAELAAANAANSRRTTYIIIGVLVLLVVASVIIFKRRR